MCLVSAAYPLEAKDGRCAWRDESWYLPSMYDRLVQKEASHEGFPSRIEQPHSAERGLRQRRDSKSFLERGEPCISMNNVRDNPSDSSRRAGSG
jgi:hypothetical protein